MPEYNRNQANKHHLYSILELPNIEENAATVLEMPQSAIVGEATPAKRTGTLSIDSGFFDDFMLPEFHGSSCISPTDQLQELLDFIDDPPEVVVKEVPPTALDTTSRRKLLLKCDQLLNEINFDLQRVSLSAI